MEFEHEGVHFYVIMPREQDGSVICRCREKINVREFVLKNPEVQDDLNQLKRELERLNRRRKLFQQIRDGKIDLRSAIEEELKTRSEMVEQAFTRPIQIWCPECRSNLGVITVSMSIDITVDRPSAKDFMNLEMPKSLRGYLLSRLNFKNEEELRAWLRGDDLAGAQEVLNQIKALQGPARELVKPMTTNLSEIERRIREEVKKRACHALDLCYERIRGPSIFQRFLGRSGWPLIGR